MTGTFLGAGDKEMNKIQSLSSSHAQRVCGETASVSRVLQELRRRGEHQGRPGEWHSRDEDLLCGSRWQRLSLSLRTTVTKEPAMFEGSRAP